MKTIRVMLVDDHPIARFGIRGILADEAEIDLVAEASNGRAALQLFTQIKPDVVMTDLHLGDMSGADIARVLTADGAKTKVLILSSYSTENDVRHALNSGAAGYVLKEADSGELVKAIRSVHCGGRFLSSVLERRLSEPNELLSAREQQLLQCLYEGRTSREVAAVLGLTEGTVSVYLTRLYAKLGANNRTNAIAIGVERGLLVVRR